MKNLSLIIGALCLVVNAIICLLISSVGNHVLAVSSIVIIVNTLLIFLCGRLDMKDGFKVSLPFFLGSMGFVEYVLSFFVGNVISGNGFIIAILVLLVFEIIVLLSAYSTSKANQGKGND